ncbi:Uncharacterised protein [Bordetella pertussis]|nr:Uncharacterised protein [Bordetella pertussis]
MVARQHHVVARRGFGLRVAVAGKPREQREPRALRARPVEVLARQDTHGQRRVGQQPDAFAVAELGQADLEDAVEQVVRVLDRGHLGQPVLLGCLQETRHAPRGFVGQADMAHLARAHEILQHLKRLFDRYGVGVVHPRVGQLAESIGGAIGPVQLVEVQVIGLQALEAGVQRLCQVLAVEKGLAVADMAGALGVAHRTSRLAGQDHLVAPSGPGQPAADAAFGASLGFRLGRHGIHLGGVDQVDAVRQRIVQLFVSLRLGVLLAPGHGAQADEADVEIGVSEFAVFHG